MTDMEQLARSFSTHDFEPVFEHLADDVVWTNHGGERFEGRDAVIAACRASADYLSDVETEFERLRTVVTDAVVVVDAQAAYTDDDGRSVVASCDLYDVRDGRIAAIASYNVELSAPAETPGA
jgi:ketosteroid isomerase-like protein